MTQMSSTSSSTATTTLASHSTASRPQDPAENPPHPSEQDDEDDEAETNQRLKLLLLRAKQSARAKASKPAEDSLAGQDEVVLFGNDEDDEAGTTGSNKTSGGATHVKPLPRSLVRPVHLSAPSALALAGSTAPSLNKGKGRAVVNESETAVPGEKWGRAPLKSLSKKEQRDRHPPTAGPKWFNLPAPTVTPELKREIQAMRLRNALDPKRFYKGGAKDKELPEFFAVGHVLPSTTSASTAAPSIPRKRTFVEELISDEQAKAYAKKKFVNEVMVKGMSGKARTRGKKVVKDAGWKKDGRRG